MIRILKFASLLMLSISGVSIAHTGPQSSNRATGGLMLLDAEYEINDNFDVEGELLLAGYKTAVNPKFSFGGGIGIMLDGEIGQTTKIGDGKGFKLFLDGQYNLKRKGSNTFAITGAFSHDRFEFEQGNTEVSWTMTEMKAGGLFIRRAGSARLYGGLEVFLYSDGESETRVANFSSSGEAERDDRLNLRLGASIAIDPSIDLRADLLLLSEQTITLASDFVF